MQVEKLKKEYRYTPDKAGVDELTNSGHTSRTLFTLAGRSYTGTDFARFAAAYPAGVRKQLDAFIVKPYLIMKIHVWSRNIRITLFGARLQGTGAVEENHRQGNP